MSNCIFCKIVKKEIPSFKIHENNEFYAFLDISQKTIGHTLVIPKKCSSNLLELTNASNYLEFIQETAKLLSSKLNTSNFNFVSNCGAIAGQEVFHTHFHIIPRYEDDKLDLFSSNNSTLIDAKIVYNKYFNTEA